MSLSPVRDTLGQTALVTGAGQGIGKAIALRLARDGFDVAVNDLECNSDKVKRVVADILAMGGGRKSTAVFADVSNENEVDQMIRAVVGTHGQLDVVIANAGIVTVKSLVETTMKERERLLDINLHGLMNTEIAAARHMIKQGTGGRIIGAASIAAYRAAPQLSLYATSKWATRGFTQAAASEWAQHGIRVNAYAPGFVDTGMWETIDEGLGAIDGSRKGAVLSKRVDERVLLKRVSVPEDVAKIVSFLASDEAEYMTGQTVIVDGGCQFT